jgi:DNA-binding transcriptional LysR family regulator
VSRDNPKDTPLNFKALQSLVAIQETGSFLKAAQHLGVNQSIISMQIKALEAELGVLLFDRSVRPPAMTEAAIAMMRPAREIVVLASTIRDIVKSPEALTGQLTLGVIPTATLSLLPNALAVLAKRYPAVKVFVKSGLSEPLIEQVRAGRLDAALITEPAQTPEDFRSDLIVRERLAIVSAVGLPAPSLADLGSSTFIRFNRHVGVGRIIDQYLSKRGLAPESVMELDSIEAILAMVERGLGISIVPEKAVAGHRSRLIIQPIDEPDAARHVSLIFRAQTLKGSLLDILSNALRQPMPDLS